MIVMLTQCFPPDRGGIEGLMGGLASALVDAGLPVTVLADRVRTGGEVPAFPFPVHRFGGARPWRRWRKMRMLARQMKTHAPQAIIADSWKSVTALPPVSVPVLVLAHGTEYPHAVSASKQARIMRALAKATAVIANSHYTAQRVQPYMAEPPSIHIIHPPIAPQPEASAAALAQIDAQIAGRGPVLVSLSRLEPRKGCDQVIRALPAILQAHPQAVYLVGGAGEDAARLQALAQALGVQASVVFLGRVGDALKAALFSRADLFAMPARREGNSVEGFGIAYLEAAWYGVPALAGCEGGAVDAVHDGQTGLVVDGADALAVEQALLQLLADPALRQRLGRAAAAHARSECQWPAAIARYRALLHR